MRITFIGHGLDDKAEKNVGKVLCSAFNPPSHFNKFIGLTAFATNSGLSRIINYISDAKSSFEKIIFYIGVNDITTQEALQSLLDNQIETYIFFIEDKLFHPKVYIFEGKVRNKIIVGSSNLTRQGLFKTNIEASVEVDYDNPDPSGKKFRKQINEYFKHLFNSTHSNVKLLTTDYLKELVEKNIVGNEWRFLKGNRFEGNEANIGNLPKRRKRRLEKIEKDLGNLKDKERRKYTNSKRNSRLVITEEYLKNWNFYFNEMKKFKAANNGNTIVPKTHPDRSLLNWYRKQKDLYNHFDANGIRLIPKEHKQALDGIEFYWGKGRELLWMRQWEEQLAKSIEYSKKKKQNYVWVTWESKKSNPNFPYRKQAQWCIRQRRRKSGEDKKKLSDYEKRRLKEVNFLEESESEGGIVNQNSFIQRLIDLHDLRTKSLKAGIRKWIPSQTDADPVVADLGNWLADNITFIRNHTKSGTQPALVKSRSKDLNDLGIDTIIGKEKNNFEFDVLDWLDMRKLYPNENPKREARKPFSKILNWEAGQKNKYDSAPEWKQKRLVELGIVKLKRK